MGSRHSFIAETKRPDISRGTKTLETAASRFAPRFAHKYAVGEMLGKGAYGAVYACNLRKPQGQEEKRDLAVKILRSSSHRQSPSDLMREGRTLEKLNHPHILKCLDVMLDKGLVYITTERLCGGDLMLGMKSHWKRSGRIPLRAIAHIVRQMSASISYLHSQCVVHRDVKGDNFLCDQPLIEDPNLHIVLADFGSAVPCNSKTRLSEKCGTRLFWAPEVFKDDHGLKVDVWAMGVLLYGLVYETFPFKTASHICNKEIQISGKRSVTSECEDMLRCALDKDEVRRISAYEMQEHPFVKQQQSLQTGPVLLTSKARGSSNKAIK
mmetsp:Transcript_142210/g.247904  ORF Transcript_142210/g.247904 Transcript_142210/m.247904 type:complete len:324 (-) Transcript_142210:76-1047(-)